MSNCEGTDMPPSDILACDYVDVSLNGEDQLRFVFQPHFPGGAVAPAGFSLEVEGARSLSRHLDAILLEKGLKA
jgi:hypothetical protein